jgi:triosephosphate isomerase (TIM)
MTRRPFVVGNWKMNTRQLEAIELAQAVSHGLPANVDVAICPPFTWLSDVYPFIAETRVQLGAQNCWNQPSGAFTGEVSPVMLAEICSFVIVGHSERRRIFGENDDLVASKTLAALDAGLNVILCVGEDLETRQEGQATTFVEAQLESAFAALSASAIQRMTIAYEPIWAIGTGISAEPSDAQEMAVAIRAFIRTQHPSESEKVRILYGGSVTADNALAILSQPEVDGALVGGASLKAESFRTIVEAASRCA